MRAAAAVIAMICVSFAGGASARAAETDCFSAINLTNDAKLGLARIVDSEPRVFFIKGSTEAKGCPAFGDECRARAFVVSGDQVLTAASVGDFVCASFISEKGLETAGWLPAHSIEAQQVALPAGLESWIGLWQATAEQQITIHRGRKRDTLSIGGEATFGARDPDRVARGGVNSGEIAAIATPVNGAVAFAMVGNAVKPYDQGGENDCKVRMRRFGEYLLVEDNRMCGGSNVSFTGAYRRK